MNTTAIRVELEISAQKIIQRLQLNNEAIEDQIEKGISLAIKDITEGDAFIQHIRTATIQEIKNITNKAILSWELKSKISKLIEEKVYKKVEEYADKIAEQITSTLK